MTAAPTPASSLGEWGAVLFGGAFCAGGLYFFWKMWQSGSRESTHNLRRERLEENRCPGCGYDVRAGHNQCPECGEDLRNAAAALAAADGSGFDVPRLNAEWPDAPIEPLPRDEADPLVTLYSTEDGGLVELIEQQLTARGVWCAVQGKQQEEVDGGYARNVTYHRLVVPESERERAEAILHRFRAPPGGMAGDADP